MRGSSVNTYLHRYIISRYHCSPGAGFLFIHYSPAIYADGKPRRRHYYYILSFAQTPFPPPPAVRIILVEHVRDLATAGRFGISGERCLEGRVGCCSST